MNRRRKTLTGWALLSAVCLLFPAGVATAQTIVRSFDGDSGPGLAVCESGVTHCGLPEMAAAVNGKQVVQVTWQNVRIYDYSGHLLQSIPMPTFIRKAGLDPLPPGPPNKRPSPTRGPFEPHIVYDEFIGRWIITVTCLNDCTLVSASSDATGSWGGVYLSCLQGGACLNLDPSIHLGYDKNGVYVCAGHIGDANPNTVPGVAFDCFAVPSVEVEAIARGKSPAHLNRAHNMPLDVIPAIDQDPSKPASAPAFFANKSCEHTAANACLKSPNFSFDWVVNTFTWNGATGTYNAGGGQQVVKTDIGSTRSKWLYNTPCCGENLSFPQAGNDTITLRTSASHRLQNVVQSGTHLQGVLGSGPCTSGCGSQGADTNNVMIWVDLDCSKPTACVVSQTAKISSASLNPVFGTVGVDAAGNVGIVAASSTTSTYLSLLLWTRRKSDPPNTFSGPTTIIVGTQPYTCENTKNIAQLASSVGIFTTRDPLDGTKLWTTEQWANDATRCVWNTRIVEYQIAPAQAGPAGQSKPKGGKQP